MYNIECNRSCPAIPTTTTTSAIYGWLVANVDKWEGTIAICKGGRSVAVVAKTNKKEVIITFLD